MHFSRIKDGTDRHIIRLLVTSQLEDEQTPTPWVIFSLWSKCRGHGDVFILFLSIVSRPTVHKAAPFLVLVYHLTKPWIQEEAAASLANLTRPRVFTEDH